MGLARVCFVRDEEHSSPPPTTPQMRGKMLRLLVCESPSRLGVGLAVEYPPPIPAGGVRSPHRICPCSSAFRCLPGTSAVVVVVVVVVVRRCFVSTLLTKTIKPGRGRGRVRPPPRGSLKNENAGVGQLIKITR